MRKIPNRTQVQYKERDGREALQDGEVPQKRDGLNFSGTASNFRKGSGKTVPFCFLRSVWLLKLMLRQNRYFHLEQCTVIETAGLQL